MPSRQLDRQRGAPIPPEPRNARDAKAAGDERAGGELRRSGPCLEGPIRFETNGGFLIGPRRASQYSDELTLTAAIDGTFPPLTGGTVTFSVDNVLVGTAPVSDSGATLHLSGSIRPGTHDVTATFSGEGCAAGSSGTATAEVIREDATVQGDGPSFVAAAAGTADALLRAHVTQQEDGAPGDLTFAAVVFQRYRGNRVGSSPDLTVRGTADAAGRVSVRVALPPDRWTVVVTFDPTSYFTGPSSSPAVIERSHVRRRAVRQ